MMDHKRWLNIIPTSYKERALKEEGGWGARAFLLFQGYFLLISRFEYWVNGQVLDSLIHLETISGKLEWLKFEKKFKSVKKLVRRLIRIFWSSEYIWDSLMTHGEKSFEALWYLDTITFDGTFIWKNNLPFENVFK